MLAILQANGNGVWNQRPCLSPSIRHHHVCCYRGLFLLDVHLAVSVCDSSSQCCVDWSAVCDCGIS